MTLTVNGEELDMPVIDIAAAKRSFICQPHCFIVAMPRVNSRRGLVELSDKRANAKRHTWLTAGTVIAAGSKTCMEVGDYTLVRPILAKRVIGLASGDFTHDGEVWIFGIGSKWVRSSATVGPKHTTWMSVGKQDGRYAAANAVSQLAPSIDNPYLRQIGAEWAASRMKHHGFSHTQDVITHKLTRTKEVHSGHEGRVIIELLPKPKMRGILHLPDGVEDRPDVARVIGCSRMCSFVAPGDFVIYQRRGMDGLYMGGNKMVSSLPERAIFARCLP